MNMNVNAIEVKDLSFSYGKNSTDILHNINLSVKSGEFLGIIGPNGGGKSTLIKQMGGLLTPSSGQVLINGRDLNRIKNAEKAREVAMVNQQNIFVFDFTVEEMVAMGRIPHGHRLSAMTAKDWDIVTEMMDRCSVGHLAKRSVNRLSGGELQRALIARALTQETPILLLDEPVSQLDLRFQWEIMDLAQALQHKTVVIVLHDLNLAARFCDRLVLLGGGQIITEGSPELVLTPENLKNAYGVSAEIETNKTTSRPFIVHFGND